MLITLSILAAIFASVTAGLIGLALFILGVAVGFALRWLTAP